MDDDLVTIASFSFIHEAELARSSLESEGIPAFVADANIVGINWLLSNAVGGVKLQVRRCDLDLAKEILGQEPEPNKEGWGECANCGSAQLEPVADRRLGFLSWLLTGMLLFRPRYKLRCTVCGTVHQDKRSKAE